MIRFFIDTDDDFDVGASLEITDEIEMWRSVRAVDRVSRAESEGEFEATLRHGRAVAAWWRVGRLLEGRVGAFVFFRGFITEVIGQGYGKTFLRARTWLQFMLWRGRTPDVVGLVAIEAVRSVVREASPGLPGARRPSAALVESLFGVNVGRRLYWRSGDRPLYWRSADKPLYWRHGPGGLTYAYGHVGDTDTVGAGLLCGPPAPAVAGAAATVIDRLTAVEYAIENYEYGRLLDEIAVLASIERGWLYSGGGVDIAFVSGAESAAPAEAAKVVSRGIFGRYAYQWHVGENAIAQVVGRVPDVQLKSGVVYRLDDVALLPGVSSWRVPVRDSGRPAEVAGELVVEWSELDGVSAAASGAAGDLLLEVFNNTGAGVTLGWIEVSGSLRVYQGGEYGERVTGRYGGSSIELAGVGGGQAGLNAALGYWGTVGAQGGAEALSVTLDGRRFAEAWGGELGTLLRTDALEAEGIVGGPDMYWIVGVRGEGSPEALTVQYDLMRFVAA